MNNMSNCSRWMRCECRVRMTMYECVGLLNQCTLLASSYALGVIKLLKCDTMLNFSSVNLHYMCLCLSLYESATKCSLSESV
jgi:hypothetical protein